MMGVPAAVMAVVGSLRPFPVTTVTMVASWGIKDCSMAFLIPAVPVAPAGSAKTPQVVPNSFIESRISWSETFTATPFDSQIP